ncbi:MAG: hypothetical protein ACYC91_16935 [Solirubrobacteraceae bacterium]
MIRLLHHARSNSVAYLALFVALGGTSYAALNLPAGSVGTRQLRTGAVTTNKLAGRSITPSKLDPRTIGGSVRHWVRISAQGAVESSSSTAHVIGNPHQGGYVISWSDTFSNRCIALATPVASAALLGPSSGYANARVTGVHPTSVWVDTYNAQGVASPAEFSLAVVC